MTYAHIRRFPGPYNLKIRQINNLLTVLINFPIQRCLNTKDTNDIPRV